MESSLVKTGFARWGGLSAHKLACHLLGGHSPTQQQGTELNSFLDECVTQASVLISSQINPCIWLHPGLLHSGGERVWSLSSTHSSERGKGSLPQRRKPCLPLPQHPQASSSHVEGNKWKQRCSWRSIDTHAWPFRALNFFLGSVRK